MDTIMNMVLLKSLLRRSVTGLICILLISCGIQSNQELEKETKKLNNYLLKMSGKPINSEKQVYLFFQLSGCSSCAKKMISFFRDNLDDEVFYFIISHVGSQKISKVLNANEIDHANCLIDKKAIATQENIMIGQGTIYLMEQGVVRGKFRINPENVDELLESLSL